ncbi:adenosylcobinamide-GDP ribazoletransferase, partial [Actinospica acidiphila]
AALTRGLHLDGLADTADGLGSGRPAEDALRIMKQSDVGPFGVLTLVLVLLVQVAALAQAYGGSWARGVLAAVVSAVAARV